MKRTETVTFTNMCMICDGDKVLVQNQDVVSIAEHAHIGKGHGFCTFHENPSYQRFMFR